MSVKKNTGLELSVKKLTASYSCFISFFLHIFSGWLFLELVPPFIIKCFNRLEICELAILVPLLCSGSIFSDDSTGSKEKFFKP